MAESALALAEVNGIRFGRLTAMKFARTRRSGNAIKLWLFRCDCGNEREFPLARVRRGEITNCGCRETEEIDRQFSLVDLSEYRKSKGKFRLLPITVRADLVRTEYKERGIYNHAITPFDLWLWDEETPFERRHVRVVERARELWNDIDPPRNEAFTLSGDGRDGLRSERAKNILRRCKVLVPRWEWQIFENTVRWDEPLGFPGSRLMTHSPCREAAALRAVWNVAETVARSLII
jgi:hypothetical protein